MLLSGKEKNLGNPLTTKTKVQTFLDRSYFSHFLYSIPNFVNQIKG
jgi:hypothetical protein